MSISKVNSFNYCKRAFKLRYIDEIREGVGELAITGVDSHEAFCLAMEHVDIDRMLRLGLVGRPWKSAVYYYLKELALEYSPQEVGYRYTNIIKNWAAHFAEYWYELRIMYDRNKTDLERYFKPVYTETLIEDRTRMVRGIIDLGLLIPHEGRDKLLVCDYKTGNVPKAVTDGKNYMKTSVSKQLHLYAGMIARNSDWKTEDMLVGVLYLGFSKKWGLVKHRPYMVIKKFNNRSYNAAMNSIEKVRDAWNKGDDYNWEPIYNMYQCEGMYTRPRSPCEYVDICWRKHLKEIAG